MCPCATPLGTYFPEGNPVYIYIYMFVCVMGFDYKVLCTTVPRKKKGNTLTLLCDLVRNSFFFIHEIVFVCLLYNRTLLVNTPPGEK